MNKKLLAAAVAGALAIPGVALANGSSVTISGFFKVGIENLSIGSAAATRTNTSEGRLVDNSSRIIFNVSEDLGGGLSAIGQLDNRFNPTAVGGSTLAGGNSWVGLKSTQWGQVTMGNSDLHYFHTADTIPGGAAALDAWSVSILGFVDHPATTTTVGTDKYYTVTAIASDTRTPSVVQYTSPTWGMFSFTAAWTPNRAGAPADLTPASPTPATTRKGEAWNFAPQLTGSNWQAGYSYWSSKADMAVEPDQRSDRLWGYYVFPQGFRVGVTWDKSRLNDAATGTELAGRTAWSLPVSYSWGPNSVGYTYTKAGNDSVGGSDTGARMDAVYYQYSLSKLTSVGVTYARINNDAKAAYNLFATGLGSTDAASLATGEDPRALQFTIFKGF